MTSYLALSLWTRRCNDVHTRKELPHPLSQLYCDAESLDDTPSFISKLPPEVEIMSTKSSPAHSLYLSWGYNSPLVLEASTWRGPARITPLRRWLKHKSTTATNRFTLLRDVAGVLTESHSKDIVHGKLTPGCVWVDENGRTAVTKSTPQPGCLEFNCSWTEEVPDVVVNARWAAPEFFALTDKDADTPRPTKMSDIYSFGCLMLQVLTGKDPYCGTKRSEQVVYLKYLGREPIDAQTPGVADHYLAFMRRCWALVPENRPTIETVVDFVHEEMKRLEE
ncbi:hypothetical protein PAXINDRAFT_103020 [Paxillus involutus ATCC 200175]|uniref:Protein kinase domain-containing protein n=1 Tax=Paxillus involutus ATCC 200175 TaxID=664439 RepID=A0A0C9T7Z2_PAXIN|nr:hypothetical protein PAXINDRAFT_103020 [Paxillus involutus ATCC 200175]